MKVLTENIEELCASEEEHRFITLIIDYPSKGLNCVSLRLLHVGCGILFEFVDVNDGGIICKYLVNTEEHEVRAINMKVGMNLVSSSIASDMISKVKAFYLVNHGIIYQYNT